MAVKGKGKNRGQPSKGQFRWQWFLFGLIGLGLFLAVNLGKLHFHGAAGGQTVKPQVSALKSPQNLNELLALPPAELNRCDIALMDLLCAEGLAGTEGLNVSNCLATLDQWAAQVQSETERNLHRFRDNPGDYHNSEGYFRMLIMAVVMYEDFGVRYNPDRIVLPQNIDANDHFFADSRDIFLHGLVGDRRMGTCSSMPILYIAIGRRLGYPLKLATTKSHLFVRWESDTDRFDVEPQIQVSVSAPVG